VPNRKKKADVRSRPVKKEEGGKNDLLIMSGRKKRSDLVGPSKRTRTFEAAYTKRKIKGRKSQRRPSSIFSAMENGLSGAGHLGGKGKKGEEGVLAGRERGKRKKEKARPDNEESCRIPTKKNELGGGRRGKRGEEEGRNSIPLTSEKKKREERTRLPDRTLVEKGLKAICRRREEERKIPSSSPY